MKKCQMTVRHKGTRQERPVCQGGLSEEVPELAVSAQESREGRAPRESGACQELRVGHIRE